MFPTYYERYKFAVRHIIREKLMHLFKSVMGVAMEENLMAVSLDDIEKTLK